MKRIIGLSQERRQLLFETPPSFEEIINGLAQLEDDLKTI